MVFLIYSRYDPPTLKQINKNLDLVPFIWATEYGQIVDLKILTFCLYTGTLHLKQASVVLLDYVKYD